MASGDTSQPAAGTDMDTGDDVSTPSARTGSPTSLEDPNLAPPVDPRAKLMEARREKNGVAVLRPKGRFRDLVFKRTFSAFDRKNEANTDNPFYGFFTLAWLGLGLFMLKTAVANWKLHGNPLGTNDIMKDTFSRDVFVLLASDGAMCALSSVSWLLQRAILSGYLDWDSTGWLLQSLWQAVFISGVIALTIARDWPWTHTVFFVLHGLVVLMKQHSYAFYNGHLSTMYKDRILLMSTLRKLRGNPAGEEATAHSTSVSSKSIRHSRRGSTTSRMPARRPSKLENSGADDLEIDHVISDINADTPVPVEDVALFDMVLEDEIDYHTKELVRNTTAKKRAYPNNLNLMNLGEYLVFPTVVYELEYPRTESINWYYVVEKVAATFGLLFVMNLVSQTFIYPVVMRSVSLKKMGVPLSDRLREFPWMFSDLIFPFMGEYLLTWFLIWETVLNALAELTRFADRSFYGPWWNSVSWDQYARDWNRPVYAFLLRHVYHSSISSMKVGKHTATLITFILSACFHELVMWCLFKKLRGYILVMQLCQLPLVRLSRTRFLRDRKILGNIIFWIGLFTGPSVLCSLYLVL